MPTVPEGFLNSLKTMDRALDIRWGAVIGKWVVERKAYFGHDELAFLKRRSARTERISRHKTATKAADAPRVLAIYQEITEEYLSGLRGNRIVVYATELNDQLFRLLALSDYQRYGGYSRFVDRTDAEEEARERDLERQAANEREVQHKDTFDKLNFIWKHRETQLLSDNKRSLSELLR